MTIYICIDSTEGTGKTTQTKLLVDYLTNEGFKVLQTKEPGTPLLPVTIKLRELMLDNKYQSDYNLFKEELRKLLENPEFLTKFSIKTINEIVNSSYTEYIPLYREYISQIIRSIHFEHLIYPSIKEQKYDFIIQDRGILSGLAYGKCCGNDIKLLENLATEITLKDSINDVYKIYDKLIYLKGDPTKNLKRAVLCKNEFKDGDVIESKGNPFMIEVQKEMENILPNFNSETINVDGLSIDEVFQNIKQKIVIEL
jgi:thymidylate kinase